MASAVGCKPALTQCLDFTVSGWRKLWQSEVESARDTDTGEKAFGVHALSVRAVRARVVPSGAPRVGCLCATYHRPMDGAPPTAALARILYPSPWPVTGFSTSSVNSASPCSSVSALFALPVALPADVIGPPDMIPFSCNVMTKVITMGVSVAIIPTMLSRTAPAPSGFSSAPLVKTPMNTTIRLWRDR